MKKLLLFLMLSYATAFYAQDKQAPLTEIDFLKEDPSMVLSIGLIQNVQTDWGKMGLRGQVKKLVEEQYSWDKILLSRMIYDFNDKGQVTCIAIMPDFYKYFEYTKEGYLEKENIGLQSVREYKYKDGKLKGAKYADNIVTSYGDNDVANLLYDEKGQITRVDYPQNALSVFYSYNNKGRMMEKKYRQTLFSGKEQNVTTILEYNDENDIEKKFTQYIGVDQPDTTFVVEMYKYQYDNNSNWLKCSYLGNGNVIHINRAIYYHDDTYSGSEESPAIDKNHVYKKNELDVLPQYPGGEAAMGQFIMDNLRYPEVAFKKGVQGRVKLGMTIDETGEIKDIKVLNRVSHECDREAIRVLKKMPKWIPAQKNGEKVNSQNEISMIFRIKK